MLWFSRSRSSTPQQVLEVLEQLRQSLQAALNHHLVSLTAWGDIVRPGEYDARHSTVNLLLVTDETSLEVLDGIRQPIATARRQVRLEVMVLTESDLQQSCDVFPVRFLDMQEHHRLVCGRDVLTELHIADDHLQLRCEQELKNLMIRLRSLYIRRAHRPNELRRVMADTITPLLRLLGVGLTLQSGISPDSHQDLLTALQEGMDLNVQVLQQVLDLKQARFRPAAAETRDVFGKYMTTVQHAASVVDQLDIST